MADTLDHLHSQLVDRKLDLDDVLARVVDEAVGRMGADRGTLYLVDRVRGELVSRVALLPEITEIRLRMGEGVAGWVAATGETIHVPHNSTDPRFSPRIDTQTGYRTRSQLAVPVLDHADTPRVGRARSIVGVLQVLNKSSGDFDPDDITALHALADGVGRLLAVSSLASQLSTVPSHPLSFGFNHIVGDSAAMREVNGHVLRAARTDATVLLRGESGTGKELLARAVHDNSDRRSGPFVVVDLAALPPELIESELFGHVRGAFTGAVRDARGRAAMAHGGTLFLDEIGELPLPIQAKLLRLLQSRSVFPVGGNRSLEVDVRFVCATHRDLEAMVARGAFREDLYYRIRVVEVKVPPLRARGHGDLDRLIDHFLFAFRRRHGRLAVRLTDEARARLHAHNWPGNVRELQHRLESALILAPGGDIDTPDLGLDSPAPPVPDNADASGFSTPLVPLHDLTAAYVQWAVAQCDGNRSEAARRLGIGRNTLLRWLNGS